MTRIPTVLLALLLPLAAAAVPHVGEADLSLLEDPAPAAFAEDEAELDRLDAAIREAQATLPGERGDVRDERDDLGDARGAIGDARDARGDARALAQSGLDQAKLRSEVAEQAWKTAIQQADVAKAELKLAKTGGDKGGIAAAKAAWLASKDDIRAKRAAHKVAEDAIDDAKTDGAAAIARSRAAVVSAKDAEDDATDAVRAAKTEVKLAHAQIDLLQAERDVVEARFEQAKATAVIDAGADLQIGDFDEALVSARADHVEAKARVAELEAEVAALVPGTGQ